MTPEQERFAIGTLKSGGAYWNGAPEGYQNGEGHKGVRLEDFVRFYQHTYGQDVDARGAIEELMRAKRVIAVDLVWGKTEYDTRSGGKSLRDARAVEDIRVGNPMVYLIERLPKPVQAKLLKHAKFQMRVAGILADAKAG